MSAAVRLKVKVVKGNLNLTIYWYFWHFPLSFRSRSLRFSVIVQESSRGSSEIFHLWYRVVEKADRRGRPGDLYWYFRIFSKKKVILCICVCICRPWIFLNSCWIFICKATQIKLLFSIWYWNICPNLMMVTGSSNSWFSPSPHGLSRGQVWNKILQKNKLLKWRQYLSVKFVLKPFFLVFVLQSAF